MTQSLPDLTQFRVEQQPNGLVHLVFDCPGKGMNVFTKRAIHELGEFAEWLHRTDVKGVLVRSGKPSGFCAGADLTELGVAYDMIVGAPEADRFDLAFNHFFPLSHAIRRLETAGKPIAAAIGGVALGGGCELALGCHYRVASSSRRAMLGLPECAVGLLPGAGGTQRLPRLVGPELGLEVLLLGRNLQGEEALKAGLVDAIVPESDEVTAAEVWLLSSAAHSVQPWDRPGSEPAQHNAIADLIDAHRGRELARMLGHEPAPLAILDCVELGFIQPIDGAIRSEMSVFARLIQRQEPRNMIRTMFLGKQAYDKAEKDGGVDEKVGNALTAISKSVEPAVRNCPALANAMIGMARGNHPVQTRVGAGLWIETQSDLRAPLQALARQVAASCHGLDDRELLQLDHALVRNGILPAYLGGTAGLMALP